MACVCYCFDDDKIRMNIMDNVKIMNLIIQR